jgi:hypothetical protein
MLNETVKKQKEERRKNRDRIKEKGVGEAKFMDNSNARDIRFPI